MSQLSLVAPDEQEWDIEDPAMPSPTLCELLDEQCNPYGKLTSPKYSVYLQPVVSVSTRTIRHVIFILLHMFLLVNPTNRKLLTGPSPSSYFNPPSPYALQQQKDDLDALPTGEDDPKLQAYDEGSSSSDSDSITSSGNSEVSTVMDADVLMEVSQPPFY